MSTALITGSTDGHGRHVALELARRGWTVLLHGRDGARGEQVRAEAGEGAQLFLADLASLAGVRHMAAEVLDRHGTGIDVLVNNAGIVSERRQESADGVELTFAVNHLAHVALTEALLAGGATPAKIVNVSSVAQAPFDWDDPLLERSYDHMRAYAQSKLAQVMWTFDLAAERPDLAVNALHPATLMDTTMVRQSWGRTNSSVEEGAQATLRLITEDAGTGRFFDGTREVWPHPSAEDAQERARLRALTEGLLGHAAG